MSSSFKCICGKYVQFGTPVKVQIDHTNSRQHWEDAYSILLAKYTTAVNEYTERIEQLVKEVSTQKEMIKSLEKRRL